jgi:hypothetical protein
MNFSIESLKGTRAFALRLIDGLSDEALNSIPEGFSNNIIWNLAHLVAVEQGILYKRSAAEPQLPDSFISKYTRGTSPEGNLSAADIAEIKSLLTSTLRQLEADFGNGVFANYNAWTTPYGVELRNIDEALQFLLFHEGMHCGYIMALKRAIAVAGQPAGIAV